jgi:hypothetical protein
MGFPMMYKIVFITFEFSKSDARFVINIKTTPYMLFAAKSQSWGTNPIVLKR